MPVVAGQNRLVEDRADAAQERLAPARPAHVIYLALGLLVGVEAKVEALALAGERGLGDGRVGGEVDAGRARHRAVEGGLGVGQRVLSGGLAGARLLLLLLRGVSFLSLLLLLLLLVAVVLDWRCELLHLLLLLNGLLLLLWLWLGAPLGWGRLSGRLAACWPLLIARLLVAQLCRRRLGAGRVGIRGRLQPLARLAAPFGRLGERVC